MRRIRRFTLGLLLALHLEAPAQVYPFRVLSAADGLPHSFAYAVAQDRWGYLWFGTFGGAARFDGESFDTWALREGLPGDDVRAIAEDRAGRLWLAVNGGVARFSRGPGGEVLPGGARPKVFTAKEGLPAPIATALVEDARGRMWAATRDGGVSRLGEDRVEETLRSGKELPAAPVWCGTRDGKGRLWFGTRGDGAVRIENGQVLRFSRAEGLPDANVFALKSGPDGAVYAATSGGLARFDEAGGRFSRVDYGPDSATSASSVAFDASGAIWVGRYGRGLAKVTPAGTTVFGEEQGLPNLFITGLFFDREGSLWITSQGAGVVQFASDRFAAFDRSTGWPGGVATSFSEEADGGALWIGSFGKGAVRLAAGKMTRVTEADGLADERVRAVLAARDGTLYVGTSSGLSARAKGAARFTSLLGGGAVGGYVTALQEGADGTLYVGAINGLVVRPASGAMRVYRSGDGLVGDIVESLSLTPDGRLWVGSAGGVAAFDGRGFEKLLSSPSGLPEGRIFRVVADRDGRLWFGGDGGLASWKPPVWTRYGVREGLPAPGVTSVAVAPDGAVWAATSRGLARFDGTRFAVRGGREEMKSSEIANRTGFVDSKGHVWWGTPFGPVVYRPESDHSNRIPPTVFVTDVEAGTRRWHRAQSVELSGNLSGAIATVTFHYVGLSFRDPAHVFFRSRLSGFDTDWSPPTSLRQVRYTNLPPGRFTFEVRAANNDGVWSPSAASVDVVVPVPWWRRPATLVLFAVAAFGFVYLGHELKVAQLRRRTRDLTKLVGERTRALVEADRKKDEFVAMVSHELRTPLTSIRGTLELVEGGTMGEVAPAILDLVRVAHRNSKRLGRLVDELLDVEKIDSGRMEFQIEPQKLMPLLKTAIDGNLGYARQTGVRLELADGIPDVEIAVDLDRFIQVLTNLLSNAIKFSPEGETVTLSAARRDGGVRISVADHGPGIPEEFRSRIYQRFARADDAESRRRGGTGLGLAIARAFVEKMGGTMSFETEPGRGTTFHVDQPVRGGL